MAKKIDINSIVFFRDAECTLEEAIEKCQPGEVIEHLPFECCDSLLATFQNNRNQKYSYGIDRRHGNWRFILYGTRTDN